MLTAVSDPFPESRQFGVFKFTEKSSGKGLGLNGDSSKREGHLKFFSFL